MIGGAGGFCVYNGANWVVELDILRYYDDGLGSWFLNATLIVKGGLGLEITMVKLINGFSLDYKKAQNGSK
jgi:hypothetical protein